MLKALHDPTVTYDSSIILNQSPSFSLWSRDTGLVSVSASVLHRNFTHPVSCLPVVTPPPFISLADSSSQFIHDFLRAFQTFPSVCVHSAIYLLHILVWLLFYFCDSLMSVCLSPSSLVWKLYQRKPCLFLICHCIPTEKLMNKYLLNGLPAKMEV